MSFDGFRPLSSKLKRREEEIHGLGSSPSVPTRIHDLNGAHPHFGDSLAFLDDVLPLDVSRPGPSSRRESRHPLTQLEDDLGAWCARQSEWIEDRHGFKAHLTS